MDVKTDKLYTFQMQFIICQLYLNRAMENKDRIIVHKELKIFLLK